MRIRRFEAPDSKTALAMVKAELGDEAVILANRTIPADGGLPRRYGRTVVEVVAATDYDLYSLAGYSDEDKESTSKPEGVQSTAEDAGKDAAAAFLGTAMAGKMDDKQGALADGVKKKKWFTRKGKKEPFLAGTEEIADASDFSGAGQRTAMKGWDSIKAQVEMRPKARAEDVIHWREQLISQLCCMQLIRKEERGRLRVLALVGSTGVGKTTTVAKIAAWARLRDGLKVALVSMDCFRIGATDQLRTYAKIMGLPCEVVLKAQDLARAVEKHQDCDLVIIDTAGKSPYDEEHVRELSRWFTSLSEVETYLTVSATTKKEDLQAVLEMYASLSVKGLVLTKLDETRAYATLCQQIVASGYPVSCLCMGQRVPEDFLPASTHALGRLFREGWQHFIGVYAGNNERQHAAVAGFH